ncbi:MAG: hypothetical protein GY819_13545, partial [Planctomycetaceae bacterium]|nr:hypothetical protein [Planctomycetaceae bacterium]
MNRIQIGVLLCLSLVFLVPTAVLGQEAATSQEPPKNDVAVDADAATGDAELQLKPGQISALKFRNIGP